MKFNTFSKTIVLAILVSSSVSIHAMEDKVNENILAQNHNAKLASLSGLPHKIKIELLQYIIGSFKNREPEAQVSQVSWWALFKSAVGLSKNMQERKPLIPEEKRPALLGREMRNVSRICQSWKKLINSPEIMKLIAHHIDPTDPTDKSAIAYLIGTQGAYTLPCDEPNNNNKQLDYKSLYQNDKAVYLEKEEEEHYKQLATKGGFQLNVIDLYLR